MTKVILLRKPEEQLEHEEARLVRLREIARIVRRDHGEHTDGFQKITEHIIQVEKRIASLKRPA